MTQTYENTTKVNLFLYKLNNHKCIEPHELINDILDFIRGNAEFWIVNSQTYLEIKQKTDANFIPDYFQNLDLIAVYNYITCNEFRKENKKENDSHSDDHKMESQLQHDGDFKDLYNLMSRQESLHFSNSNNIIIFEMHFIPLIFQFFLIKYEDFFNEINEQYSN